MRGVVTDETGNRYGRLIVVKQINKGEKGRALWLCKCDCGGETITQGYSLKSGNTKSCGCFRREMRSKIRAIDLTGKRFGKLIVLSREGTKNGSLTWLCKCDCGKEKIINGRDLRNGNTKSCGCWHKNIISLPLGKAAAKRTLWILKYGALKRGLEWMLSDEQAHSLIIQSCHYCGIEPKQSCNNWKQKGQKRFNGKFLYNGIDRVDNSRGYIAGNVVPCCGTCNRAKGTLTVNKFYEWINRLKETNEEQIKAAWEML